jgi:cobalt/nickel transport system permease protein
MHIPDGFLTPPVWLTLDAISAPAIGWVAHRADRQARKAPLDQAAPPTRIPLLGVMGAFVFAAQMINVPVGLGASGHLLGSSLLAIVLGPAAAALVMTAVLILQALLFQDGGVLVLGANIFNMALVGVAAGYLPTRLWGRTPIPVFLGGALSVLTSGPLVLWQLSLSGVAITARPLWIALGLFAVTAVLEGAITLGAIRAIHRLSPQSLPEHPSVSFPTRAALAIAALVLGIASAWIASAAPDTLQHLAATIGLEARPAWPYAPMPGYQLAALAWLGRPFAGIAGIATIYGICSIGGKRR